jgi:hypothetical protein
VRCVYLLWLRFLPRLNLAQCKADLDKQLGSDTEYYFGAVDRYLRAKLSKGEMEQVAMIALGPQHCTSASCAVLRARRVCEPHHYQSCVSHQLCVQCMCMCPNPPVHLHNMFFLTLIYNAHSSELPPIEDAPATLAIAHDTPAAPAPLLPRQPKKPTGVCLGMLQDCFVCFRIPNLLKFGRGVIC